MAHLLRERQNLKERIDELLSVTREWIRTEKDHTKAIRELIAVLKRLEKSV